MPASPENLAKIKVEVEAGASCRRSPPRTPIERTEAL